MKKLLPVLAISTLLTVGMGSALAASNISLNQAINIAKNRVGGDLISVDVDFDDNYQNRDDYKIKFVNNNTVYEVEVDANTGNINDVDEDNLDSSDRSKYDAFKQARISFTQAMQTASTHINGEVIDAEFDVENGKSIYELDALKNGQKYEVEIDANTGAVISSK